MVSEELASAMRKSSQVTKIILCHEKEKEKEKLSSVRCT